MRLYILSLSLLTFAVGLSAQENRFASANDVTWNSLGTNENNSMPLGNGDVALNVWTEQDGGIVLLIAKSDAWSENGQLLKLGRVRITLTPNPFLSAASFKQTLELENGQIEIQGDKTSVRVWTDANRPVIHIEAKAERPLLLEAKAERWRLK